MIVKIFWQPECSKCQQAKELGESLKKDGISVEFHNIKEVDGLSESIFYDVLSTPSVVVVENGEEKAAWHGELPEVNSVKDLI